MASWVFDFQQDDQQELQCPGPQAIPNHDMLAEAPRPLRCSTDHSGWKMPAAECRTWRRFRRGKLPTAWVQWAKVIFRWRCAWFLMNLCLMIMMPAQTYMKGRGNEMTNEWTNQENKTERQRWKKDKKDNRKKHEGTQVFWNSDHIPTIPHISPQHNHTHTIPIPNLAIHRLLQQKLGGAPGVVVNQSHRSDEGNAVARLGVEDSHADLRGVFVAAETGNRMLRGKERRWKRGLGGTGNGGKTVWF